MTPPKDITARAVAEILDGRHDGRLKEIVEAIQKREDDGDVDFVWKIDLTDLGGESWDRRSATVGELRWAEQATGIRWKFLDPSHSMEHFAALVTGHYYKANGLSHEEALAKADAITEEQAAASVSDYERVNPPKASSPSTTS